MNKFQAHENCKSNGMLRRLVCYTENNRVISTPYRLCDGCNAVIKIEQVEIIPSQN